MKILFTTEKSDRRDIYFPDAVLQDLNALGEVIFNEKSTPLTQQELIGSIKDIDVCITHWECPTFTPEVLSEANRLKLIVHAAGSVADLVTQQVYERGIKVCSANNIMAKHVAEGVLSYILAGLRWLPQQASDMKYKKIWNKKLIESKSLIGAKISLIGLGTIGRYLIDFLSPFDVQIKVFDPYLSEQMISRYGNVKLSSLDEALSWGDVVSIHASLTQETRGMLDKDKLALIKNGALLVNTARGAIINETALINELQTGRLHAVLDVFETEPLLLDSALRNFENVILMPHVAGITAREQMTLAMVEEIRRYSKGEPLQYEIPYEKFKLMTKEH